MEPAHHRAAVAAHGARVAALRSDCLDRPVAACPGWDVARVVGHLGRVHRWAASYLATAPDGTGDAGPRPPGPDRILEWYAESLQLLLDEFDRHDPTERVGSFVGPRSVAFWLRRQAHETAVHRWDVEAAAGLDDLAVEPELAADGVDEWLEVFVPRFAPSAGGVPADLVGATLHVHGTDDGVSGAEWLLRLTAAGAEVERVHAKGDAALRGSTSDLLLVAWHRLPLRTLDVVGDAERAAAVLDLVHVT